MATRISEVVPKSQKKVPNHGPTISLSTLPSASMKSRFGASERPSPKTVE